MKKEKNKVKKIVLSVLGAILALVIILTAVTAVIASGNVKSMNQAIDTAVAEISAKYSVSEIECGEYAEMKIYGIMKFHVRQYEVQDIGNLAVMKVNMGVMQMATIILTPEEKNLPLLSVDYMYILGSRKGYLEFYDLVKVKDNTYKALLTELTNVQKNYDDFENVVPSEAWYDELVTVGTYKKWQPADDDIANNMLADNLKEYLNTAGQLPELTAEEQQEKKKITREYTDGLIKYGGISTDAFKSSLGEETTRDFFDEVLFGTCF